MQFAVGYQLPVPGEEPFLDVVRDYRDRIAEVYFPWLDMPSGRSPLSSMQGVVDWEAQEHLEADLVALRELGVRPDLLLNASCFGKWGVSRYLENQVGSVVTHLRDLIGLDLVTTMSPYVAAVIKRHFPEVEVRASVNMRLGTVKAFAYVAHLFDSYHLQREYNRDLERTAELKQWCDAHGKGLVMLANSGCLSFCAVQTFHDNLVAHEEEVNEIGRGDACGPAECWDFLKKRENWVCFLQNTWVRPEDLHNYEGTFPVVKLATRMHQNPRRVIAAYCGGRFVGNLPDLFEPGHGPVFAPSVVDNTRFPADWFERTTACDKRCHQCGYCEAVLEQVLVRCG